MTGKKSTVVTTLRIYSSCLERNQQLLPHSEYTAHVWKEINSCYHTQNIQLMTGKKSTVVTTLRIYSSCLERNQQLLPHSEYTPHVWKEINSCYHTQNIQLMTGKKSTVVTTLRIYSSCLERNQQLLPHSEYTAHVWKEINSCYHTQNIQLMTGKKSTVVTTLRIYSSCLERNQQLLPHSEYTPHVWKEINSIMQTCLCNIQYNLSNPACYQTEKKIRIRQGTGIERLTYLRDIKVSLVSIQHKVNNGYVNKLYTQIHSRLKTCFNFLSTNKTFKNKISVFVVYTYVPPSCIYIHALVLTSLK